MINLRPIQTLVRSLITASELVDLHKKTEYTPCMRLHSARPPPDDLHTPYPLSSSYSSLNKKLCLPSPRSLVVALSLIFLLLCQSDLVFPVFALRSPALRSTRAPCHTIDTGLTQSIIKAWVLLFCATKMLLLSFLNIFLSPLVGAVRFLVLHVPAKLLRSQPLTFSGAILTHLTLCLPSSRLTFSGARVVLVSVS